MWEIKDSWKCTFFVPPCKLGEILCPEVQLSASFFPPSSIPLISFPLEFPYTNKRNQDVSEWFKQKGVEEKSEAEEDSKTDKRTDRN